MANISVRDFMETVNYRITEGSDYGWQCYGPNAFCLDSWDGAQEGHSISMVFDTLTQQVYEISAHDYNRDRAYRWINPDYKQSHDDEALSREVQVGQAWDGVNYVNLEVPDDILSKSLAMVQGQEYDTRVQVPVDLPQQDLFQLMMQAHEQDITLNMMVERILREQIRKEEVNYDTNN